MRMPSLALISLAVISYFLDGSLKTLQLPAEPNEGGDAETGCSNLVQNGQQMIEDARVTMDLLETQANDLRFLSQGQGSTAAAAPFVAATGAGISPHGSHSSPGENSPNPSAYTPATARSSGATPSLKRKPEDDETTPGAGGGGGGGNGVGGSNNKQQRSKRNRYISIACNECKRRKIKCNGETPCQRCGNLNLQCLYAPNCCSNSFKDSEEFHQMAEKVTQLQEQVETLFQSMAALRQETLRLAPIQERILPLPSGTVSPSPSSSLTSSFPPRPDLPPPFRGQQQQLPPFRGPTSVAFTVDVAKNTLHNMGYSGGAAAAAGMMDDAEPVGMLAADAVDPSTSPFLHPSSSSAAESAARRAAASAAAPPPDPLWEFDRDEMLRLCRVHDEEIGIMYPVVDVGMIMAHAEKLATWMESAKRNGLTSSFGQDEGISDRKTLILKAIMCCGMVVENHGHSDKAARLYDSIQPIVDKKLMNDPASMEDLPFLALVGGYRFLSNDEILAWRVVGMLTRNCLELGLHRGESLEHISDPVRRQEAINTFWTAYVLDRRWSFGTGLPWVLQDENVDPKLPYPSEHPYLVAMITYSRVAAKVWRLVHYFEPAIVRVLKHEDFEELDKEIFKWYDSVPEEVKIKSLDVLPIVGDPMYNIQRLQVWTRLRLNQIRTWLYTPVLHSASSIQANMPLAQTVVDVSRETIRYLALLNNETSVYQRVQIFYHMFLTSAIAALFLASTHAPLHFSASCRTEFYMALDLIKGLSGKSWVSQRLWRMVRSLKAYAPRLGLQEDDTAAASAAAAAAATTAPPRLNGGHKPLPPNGAAATTPQVGGAEDPNNGLRLHNEFTKIYEGCLGVGVSGDGRGRVGGLGYLNGGMPRPDQNGYEDAEDMFFQQFRDNMF